MHESEFSQTRLVEHGAAEVDHTWLWRLSTRFACGLAVPGPANLHPVLPASLVSWTCAPPTPLAASWARLLAATMQSPHSLTLLLNPVTKSLRLRFLHIVFLVYLVQRAVLVATSDLYCCVSCSSRPSAPSRKPLPTVFEPGATVTFHFVCSSCFLPL